MAKKAARNLVIVESPAKAKTIGKYLGPDYEVRASMGHLRDLPKSKLGVDVEHDFEPNYRPIRGKEELINELKKLSKASDTVYLATDPDREGEAISWHLKELLNIPDEKTYRVTFNEITKKVVNESIAAPRAIDQNLVDAQQARRILDRIVGYELSPLLWRKIRRGLSAGRVQSVATRLVAEREEEIRAFVPQEYWTIEAELERVRPNLGGFKAQFYGREKKMELRSREEADDIFQEVFLRYVSKAPVFDSPAHEKAWFCRVTINCSNSYWRNPFRRRTAPLEAAEHCIQPGPEPPLFTCCSAASNRMQPQSTWFFTSRPSAASSSRSRLLPTCPRSPV